MFKPSLSVRPIGVGLIIGILSAALFVGGVLESWSALAGDRLFLQRPSDPSIVIVAIDDASLSAVGRWPWNRSVHAELITRLANAGVRSIGYDVNFPEPSDTENDTKLADAIGKAGNVVLPIELALRSGRDALIFDPAASVQPIPLIREATRSLGHTNTPPDVDGVVRRIPLAAATADGIVTPAFAAQVLQIAHPGYDFQQVPTDSISRVSVNFNGPPTRNFETIRAIDVLRGQIEPSVLRDKSVFVGSTAADLHDDQLVPTSNGTPMPGVELHASLYDTLLTERWLLPVPKYVGALFLVLLGFLIGLFVTLLRARYSAPLSFVVWIGILFAAFILFDRGYRIDLVWPTLTVVFAYALVTLERRITSDRERRKLQSAFSRYVSVSVVDAILRDPSRLKLGGEKRRMSVMFSDVRGFTSISEKLTPEALVDVMNTYLTRMTDIVFANDGVLDKYIGDAVMAFWNAPFDQPDHALRAIKTALAMQRALREMNDAKAFGDDLNLKIGIGINTGEMIVGNMGSEVRFDYTVIGDNVNLASRMEGITKEYGVGILISEATRTDAVDSVLTRRIDKVAVKGKKEPVTMYEVMGLMNDVSEADRRLAQDFEDALDAYFAKDFPSAIQKAEAMLVSHPEDGPSKTLLERSREWMNNPPPADWNGTWIFTKK
ncbi:MAG: adenylate/guanylate cyclase domain-containing protein [Patescibacteria group bacterium]|jgi:adenylate cyclase